MSKYTVYGYTNHKRTLIDCLNVKRFALALAMISLTAYPIVRLYANKKTETFRR